MRKVTLSCIVFSAILLISISSIPAAKASIDNHNWLGALMKEYDSFYGTSVTSFEEGTTATLDVKVESDYWYPRPTNVSAVIVGFDWNTNYTSTEVNSTNISRIPYGQYRIFRITFTLPSVSEAPNSMTHRYTIYVEHANSTDHKISTWTTTRTNFVVFSSSQAGAYRARKEYQVYGTPFGIGFFTAEAREAIQKASVAAGWGSTQYTAGDFGGSKTSYENALELTKQAWANETERWGSFEDTFEGLLKGYDTLLTMQGYAWIVFGIGFFFMGIGVMVYLVRKSGAPPTS